MNNQIHGRFNMSQRIAELKDLHIKSKPELKLFLKNADAAMKERSVPHLVKFTYGVQDIVKGYDWVIDELLVEIDRLNKLIKESV